VNADESLYTKIGQAHVRDYVVNPEIVPARSVPDSEILGCKVLLDSPQPTLGWVVGVRPDEQPCLVIQLNDGLHVTAHRDIVHVIRTRRTT
jgi:hypothetical protein